MSTPKSTEGRVTRLIEESGEPDAPRRKPYHPPSLTVYGSIQKLTNATTQGTIGDKGSMMRTCL